MNEHEDSHKANFFDAETLEQYWIPGAKKDGGDRLYPGTIEIDEDAREEYWVQIREQPGLEHLGTIRCTGKYGGKG